MCEMLVCSAFMDESSPEQLGVKCKTEKDKDEPLHKRTAGRNAHLGNTKQYEGLTNSHSLNKPNLE